MEQASWYWIEKACRFLEDLLMIDMISEDVVGLKESNFEEDGIRSEFSDGQ